MTFLYVLIAVGLILSAVQALRVKSLLASALWLAVVSGLVSLFMYMLGSPGIAAVELSVGAGLVTVLFVFVISITGNEKLPDKPLFPRWLALVITIVSFGALAWFWFKSGINPALDTEKADILADTIWVDRKLDIYLQAALLISGIFGTLLLITPSVTKRVKENKQ